MADGTVLAVERDLPWLPWPSTVSLIASAAEPPRELVTTAFALAFDCDAILLADVRVGGRRWNPPGGHLEPGETAAAAAVRETVEETGAHVGGLRPLAHQRIELMCPRPEGHRYPYPVGYQVFFRAEIVGLDPFAGNDEVARRGFFAPAAARRLAWVRRTRALYELALADAVATSSPRGA